MIVNPVVYGGAAETCSGTTYHNGLVYYFDGKNYNSESGFGLNIVAAKNSLLVFSASTSLRDDAFAGLTTILEPNSGRIRVLRVDSDFHIGYP